LNRGPPAPKAGALTKLRYTPVGIAGFEPATSASRRQRPGQAGPYPGGPPRIRTENLLLAGESLCQLELAAHEGAPANESTRQPRRPYPGSRRSVPGSLRRSWCSAVQMSSTARHVHPGGWCSAGMAGVEPTTSGFGGRRATVAPHPYAIEKPPAGGFPASGFRLSVSLPYPEASRAASVPGCENADAGMLACLSSRSHRTGDQGFTVIPSLSPTATVRSNVRGGNGISRDLIADAPSLIPPGSRPRQRGRRGPRPRPPVM
jgi:hypothetical protein